jgi:hypothetical protein
MRDSGKVNKCCQLPRSASFPVTLLPRRFNNNVWGVDLREKMRDTGKVNKVCQLPRSASFPVINSRDVFTKKFSGVDYGKRCESREKLIKFVNSRALASFPENQLPRNSSGVDSREKMRGSGKVNKICQLPRSASFPVINSRDVSTIMSGELTLGKRCEAREKLINIVNSRDPHLFP